MPTDTPTSTAAPQREQPIRVPVLYGLAFGAIQAVSPRIRGIAGRAGSQLMRPVLFRSRHGNGGHGGTR
jgi:hypothetical protein